MTKGIEGWIEYRISASSFNENERREIGEHALAAALFCYMQEPQSDIEAHYSVRTAPYDDTVMQLYVKQAATELFVPVDEKMELFGAVFEDSFEGDLAHRVTAVRGSREVSSVPE
jgi:hypothetical protein